MPKADALNNELVSIITPTYNSALTIAYTIQSVLAQSYSQWQMFIVDDASTDNTVDIIKKWQALDDRILLIQLDCNSGAAIARNTAIKLATGRYIAFLDSDDRWLEDKLTQHIGFMTKHKAGLSFTAYKKVSEQGNHINDMGVPAQINYTQLLKCNVIGCLTAIYDTHKIGKVYMPEIRTRQDYGLWLYILKNKVKVAHGLNKVLATYLVREDSISANKKSAAISTFKLYRDVENLGSIRSLYCFFGYAIRGVVRSRYPKVAIRMGFNYPPDNTHN